MRICIAILTALVASINASASMAVVIDTFTTPGFGMSADDSTPSVSNFDFAAPTNIIGLERDIRLLRTGSGPTASTIGYFPTFLQIVPGNHSPITVTFQWDGFDSSNAINIAGLPITDLTAGGANNISTHVSNGAAPVTAPFTIWDRGGNSATHSLVIPPSFDDDLLFFFADFTPTINMNQARALQLEFQMPPGITFYINDVLQTNYLFTGVPEPSMMTLLAPLLAGLAWKRRRSRHLEASSA